MNKEEFRKLKQLDRIEYILIRNKIEENRGLIIFSAINEYLFILLHFIEISLLMYIGFKSFYLIKVIFPISKLMIFCLGIILGIDLIYLAIRKMKIKKLNKRFKKDE